MPPGQEGRPSTGIGFLRQSCTSRQRVFLGHHPARLLADFSIESIHSERWLLAHALDEPRPWRQPPRVFVNLQHAVFHERCHFETEFPLSRLHRMHRSGLLGHVLENRCVGLLADQVSNGMTGVLQFNGKMALVGQKHAQFLLVVGASSRLVRGFNQHDADLSVEVERFEKCRVQLVVGQPHPSVGRVKLDGSERLGKGAGSFVCEVNTR